MKAIVWTKYGGPETLQLQEVEKPSPKDDEVLIKIHATTVTAGDCEVRSQDFDFLMRIMMRAYIGLIKPKRIRILGQELAGEIVEIGKDVSRYKIGDKIFAGTGFNMGAYAQYICFPENPKTMEGVLSKMPTNMSYEEAAAVPLGGFEALHYLRKAKIIKGEKVLIVGSGGSIGTIAVQLAKYYGAEVTCVDSGEKLEMLRSIGADHVIDFTKEDFTKNGVSYDVIFDIVGKAPFSGSIKSLNKNGRLLLANSGMINLKKPPKGSTKQVIAGGTVRTPEDFKYLIELIEAGTIRTVIDRTFPLEQMIEAHEYVEAGGKKGNLVIKISHD
jgi:NADPH:quinone reductase-like Zn-dependent oxidoreductase